MILPPEGHQEFASPEEALAHFGILGMRWGVRKDREHISGFNSFGQPYDPKAANGQGIDDYKLKKTDKLRVDHSEGFANVRSERGFRGEQARKNYEGVVDEFKKLREEYPEVANLKVEIVPMSHFGGYISSSLQAAVMHSHQGQVTIGYNDNSKDFTPRSLKSWSKWVPGMQYPGYAGRHEMGHVLAVSKGLLPETASIYQHKGTLKRLDALDKYNSVVETQHKDIIARNGLSFQGLGTLGNYAKTSPSEAFAEAFGHYHTPELRAKMSPELQKKVKAMLDDKGGKS